MDEFSALQSLAGGMMIGLAAALLLLFNGRVCGVSGIVGGLVHFAPGETSWRLSFVTGLLAGGLLLAVLYAPALTIALDRSLPAIAFAGLLVGVGTRMGSGCTSGHGVCGLGRFSPRSLVAVVVFMTCGAMVAIGVNHVLGGRI